MYVDLDVAVVGHLRSTKDFGQPAMFDLVDNLGLLSCEVVNGRTSDKQIFALNVQFSIG